MAPHFRTATPPLDGRPLLSVEPAGPAEELDHVVHAGRAAEDLAVDAHAKPKSNGGNMYGHSELFVGRFRFLSDETFTDEKGNTTILDDEVLMKQARALLPELQRA